MITFCIGVNFKGHGTAWDQQVGGQHAFGNRGAVLSNHFWLRIGLEVGAQCFFQRFFAFFREF